MSSRNYLLTSAVPYTFTTPNICKVIDTQGIVHETHVVEDGAERPYRRATCCARADWGAVEPLFKTDDDAVTTCLFCIGAPRG